MSKQFHKDCLEEVENKLRNAAKDINPRKAAERARFMKTQMPLLGLTVPLQRKCLKQGYSFSKRAATAQLPIWDHIWTHACTHEGRMQAGFFIEKAPITADIRFNWAREWVESVNCWDQSDTLSHVVSDAMESDLAATLPTLEAWSEDANSWLRRQALVGLFFYARFRRSFPPVDTALRLVEARLNDDDYYVQKGLGWCVRECFLVYPAETLEFLKNNAVTIRPAAWQAATEKLSKAQKAEIKALRNAK